MAIVKPNLHRLNRSQCFCWGPTRPGNERGCVEAGSARLSVIRHRATLAGKRMERRPAGWFEHLHKHFKHFKLYSFVFVLFYE